jgi:hypothetical protein
LLVPRNRYNGERNVDSVSKCGLSQRAEAMDERQFFVTKSPIPDALTFRFVKIDRAHKTRIRFVRQFNNFWKHKSSNSNIAAFVFVHVHNEKRRLGMHQRQRLLQG